MKSRTLIIITYIYLALLILIPKSINSIFSILPIRLVISTIYVGINIFSMIKNKKRELYGKKYFVIYLLFVLFSLPSLFVSKHILNSFYTLFKFIVAFLVFMSVINLDINKKDLKKYSYILLIPIIIILIYGLIQYIFNINLFTVGVSNFPGAKGRISTNFFNTIYYSIFLNIIIILLTFISYKDSNKLRKLLTCLIIALSYISLLFTFTRSAILVFVCSLIITLIINHKTIINKYLLPTYIIMISLSLLIPGVKFLYSESVKDISSIISNKLIIKLIPHSKKITKEEQEKYGLNYEGVVEFTDDPSINKRIELSNIGNTIAKDHLGIGIGLGSYESYVYSLDYITKYPEFAQYKTFPHSSLVLMYAEVSIFALLSFIAFIFTIIIEFIITWFKNLKKNIEIKEYSALSLTIIAGFLVVNILAENAVYDSQIFPLFMVIIGFLINLSLKNKKGDVKNA